MFEIFEITCLHNLLCRVAEDGSNATRVPESHHLAANTVSELFIALDYEHSGAFFRSDFASAKPAKPSPTAIKSNCTLTCHIIHWHFRACLIARVLHNTCLLFA